MNILEAISELLKFSSDIPINCSNESITTTKRNKLVRRNTNKENAEIDIGLCNSKDSSTINLQTDNSIKVKEEPISIQPSKSNIKELLSQRILSKSSCENFNSISNRASESDKEIRNVEITNLQKDERFTVIEVNNENLLRCCTCKKTFNQNDFEDHFDFEHRIPRYVCNVCGKICTTRGSLHSHQKYVHKLPNDKFCPHCGKRYKTNSNLSFHIKTAHVNIIEWKCAFCNKIFSTKYNLKTHQNRTHTTSKEYYVCQICNKKFRQKCYLTIHERSVHLGIRDYKCAFCGKTFIQKSIWFKHEQNHYRYELERIKT